MARYVWNDLKVANERHGGVKARNDVIYICKENGFQVFNYYNSKVICLKPFLLFLSVLRFFFLIKRDDKFLFQYPINIEQRIILRIFKKIIGFKCIFIVHDLESLRMGWPSIKENEDFEWADSFIVLNTKMKAYIIDKFNINRKIVQLNLWDYIINNTTYLYFKGASYDCTRLKVLIAGNLDQRKVGYLRELQLITNVDFFLMGQNFDKSLISGLNIHHLGEFSPESPPDFSSFKNLFGLIWDGDSIDTCRGNYGSYLRINLPHKASFYLANRLPVIVWSQASISHIIQKLEVGFTVDSLWEIPDKLPSFVVNEKRLDLLSSRIRNGWFLKKALARLG